MQARRRLKIALIADLHYGTGGAIPKRRSAIAGILLKRAVRRLNRQVRPDVTLVLGDLLDNGASGDAPDRLAHIRSLLDGLEAPYIAIPGNHDGDPSAFYRIFHRPRDFEDIGGARFVSFVDPEEPGFNASRSAADLERFRLARSGYRGPIVALQHTCLFPPGRAAAPYNYTNADEIIAAMREAGVALSASGHYHQGAEEVRAGDAVFVNAPALCEAPFPFLVVTLENGQVRTRGHELAMPANLRLFDGHVHTPLAYCNADITVEKAIDLANAFGLAGLAFAEHSGHLYFGRDRYSGSACFRDGMAAARPEDNRIRDYLDMKRAYERRSVRFGLEADCDYRGNLLLKDEDRGRFDYIVGAIHRLPALTKGTPSGKADQDDFLRLAEKMLAHDIHVLAHPFRVFRRNGQPPPESLFRPIAQLLRKRHVAAEINFHTNEPPVGFIRACLELGVKFSFASDAHELSEIGDFAYHLALLKEAGFDGELSDVLMPHGMARRAAK